MTTRPTRARGLGATARPPAVALLGQIEPTAIQAAVRAWHAGRRRQLAFREASDPYALLVAETMAQQTQVSRVDPAWRLFLDRFPTVGALATAPTAEVVRAWTGLGYNRRAIALQRAARLVVARHGGRLPGRVVELEALPGVGPYTARAVAAVGFGIPVAAVDTNVARVVGRLLVGHGREGDPGRALGRRQLQAAADALVDAADPQGWSHALMDLGAAVCRPRPRCGECPLRYHCDYRRSPPDGARRGGRVPAAARPVRAPATRFSATRRWLRGRIVERLRRSADGEWIDLGYPLGEHDEAAVSAALEALARDGLIERDGRGRARLPR